MRPERLTHAEIQRRVLALQSIGVKEGALDGVLQATTREAQKAERERVLRAMRKRYRARVRELHPDLNGGDPQKAEELRSLIAAWGDLERFEPPLPQQRQAVPAQVFRGPAWAGFSSSSTTGTFDPVAWWMAPNGRWPR